jgi:hypothetical protein
MARRIVSRSAIAGLIRAQMSLFPQCNGCTCGSVRWRNADGDGCNWIVSRLDGSGSLGCLDRLGPLLNNLRDNFNVRGPKPVEVSARRTACATVRIAPLPEALAVSDLLAASTSAIRESRAMLCFLESTRGATANQCGMSKSAVAASRRLLRQL